MASTLPGPRRRAGSIDAGRRDLTPATARSRWTKPRSPAARSSASVPRCGDPALLDHRDRVGDRLDVGETVRDEQGGSGEAADVAGQIGAHVGPQLDIERGHRLVEQQHVGLGSQRARERDALGLTSGQARPDSVRRVAQPEAVEVRLGCAPRGILPAPRTRAEKATLSRTVRCRNSR